MATNEDLQADATADLLRRLTDQTSTLIRQEMELARVELAQPPPPAPERRAAGPTPLLGLGAAGAFVAGAVLALSTLIDAWIAAFGVAVVLAVLAVVSAAVTRSREAQPIADPVARERLFHESETGEHDVVQGTLEPEFELEPEPDSEVIAVYAQPAEDDARGDDFRA